MTVSPTASSTSCSVPFETASVRPAPLMVARWAQLGTRIARIIAAGVNTLKFTVSPQGSASEQTRCRQHQLSRSKGTSMRKRPKSLCCCCHVQAVVTLTVTVPSPRSVLITAGASITTAKVLVCGCFIARCETNFGHLTRRQAKLYERSGMQKFSLGLRAFLPLIEIAAQDTAERPVRHET